MNKNKNITIEETFKIAVKYHEQNKLKEAQELYNQVLKIDPNQSAVLNNLGVILGQLGGYQKAKDCYEKAIEIDPNYSEAHNNLGLIFQAVKDYQKAINCYEKAIEINPNYANANYNLGVVFQVLAEYQKAKGYLEKAIEINPNYSLAHNNLGAIFQKLDENQKARNNFEKAIEINPNYVDAHRNLGLIFQVLAEYQKAKDCYEKAIEIDPNYKDAYWNLHSTVSNTNEALTILKKLYKIDNKDSRARIMMSVIEGYKGNFNKFNDLLSSPVSSDPFMRSVKWVFSLPQLPKIFFNRGSFFDNVIQLSESSRPFYEFGVWKGLSFQYLINTFKKGFGFDTFTGLPEDWHRELKGSYSALGAVPKIEGGEFIVGKFEDTLANFFSKERPKASLINFDADLYSSTLCALNYSNKVIDEKTILVFDELIMNDKWEEDEYKALNEFCDKLGYSYEVIAVSFYTKQVAVKLNK